MAVTVQFLAPPEIDLHEIAKAIDLGLQDAIGIVKVDFELATGTWEKQPNWTIIEPYTNSSGHRVVSCVTTDQPFVWVDKGTAPHLIPKEPKPLGKTLAFRTGFVPKTRPGQLMAGPGAKFGPWRFPRQVHHPGIKARDISGTVAKDITERVHHLIRKRFVSDVKSF